MNHTTTGYGLTREQLASIPNRHLTETGTGSLRDLLAAHGWRMSLADLHAERVRRGFAKNPKKHTGWTPLTGKDKR